MELSGKVPQDLIRKLFVVTEACQIPKEKARTIVIERATLKFTVDTVACPAEAQLGSVQRGKRAWRMF